MSFRVDLHTREYIGYREHTPGSLLVAPCDLLNRTMEQLVPDQHVIELFNKAIWEAREYLVPQRISYTLRSRPRRTNVAVVGNAIYFDVQELIG